MFVSCVRCRRGFNPDIRDDTTYRVESKRLLKDLSPNAKIFARLVLVRQTGP
jgi:hypothetical protein